MRINYNATAMSAVTTLNKNDQNAAASTQRLSSGYKINRAKDNPAGYALSRKMQLQIRGLNQAASNSSDAVNIIKTADGALSEVHAMLQRMNELAVKSANGTNSDSDRALIDEELQELKKEIQRVADSTEFNGQKLLDGSFGLKGYTDDKDVKVTAYDDSNQVGKYNIQLDGITFDADGYINSALEDLSVTDLGGASSLLPANATVSSVVDNIVTISGSNGFSMSLKLADTYAGTPIEIDLTGKGAMTIQIGANEGQTIDVEIPDVGLEKMGLSRLSVETKENAEKAIAKLEAAITYVSKMRSKLGAVQNRLESIGNTLDINEENMTEAYSNIMDVDMAEEYTEYSTHQILVQASTSVLSQANERPSQVLQLLN